MKMIRIGALVSLGLMIIVVCSFLGTYAETDFPVLSVGDRWSYGWFNGEFTNTTGEVGGHMINVTVDRVEDFEGVPCYVCIYEYSANLYENRTQTVWLTSDWTVLKTEDQYIYANPEAETRITFVWSPGMKLYDFPLTVGKEWSDRSYRKIEQTWWQGGDEETDTGTDYIDWSRKIVSTETVIVPAGTFETYVLEGFGGEPPVWFELRSYFSPDAKNYVKAESIGEGGGGEVLTSYELVPQGSEQGGQQESGFLNLILPIGLTASIGILGVIFFFLRRRQKEPWDI